MASQDSRATGISGRYATALFSLAEQEGQLDQVAQDLDGLSAMIADSHDLRRLILSPVISRDDQAKAMAVILEKAEMGDITKKFIGLVTRNRRLFALSRIIVSYRALLAASRGEAAAEVVSATELSDKQVKAIGDALKKAVGSKVTVTAKVDPEVLGGLIVRVGSRMFDTSLRTKLQQLRLAMKGVA